MRALLRQPVEHKAAECRCTPPQQPAQPESRAGAAAGVHRWPSRSCRPRPCRTWCASSGCTAQLKSGFCQVPAAVTGCRPPRWRPRCMIDATCPENRADARRASDTGSHLVSHHCCQRGCASARTCFASVRAWHSIVVCTEGDAAATRHDADALNSLQQQLLAGLSGLLLQQAGHHSTCGCRHLTCCHRGEAHLPRGTMLTRSTASSRGCLPACRDCCRLTAQISPTTRHGIGLL